MGHIEALGGAWRGARAWLSGALLLALVAATPSADLSVTGQVLFGTAAGATKAATVDIVTVYASNPTYMRMRAEGLSQTDGARGSKLFAEAQTHTNKALARAAKTADVEVVTVPGGVSGGDAPIADLTARVIELLPVYHVEGKLLSGNAKDARLIAELASAQLLNAIPAWREYQPLDESKPEYHFLRKQAQDQFEAAVLKVARAGNYNAVVERGGVTSRLGPVPDITAAAIAALQP